jgi:hypothetical protein
MVMDSPRSTLSRSSPKCVFASNAPTDSITAPHQPVYPSGLTEGADSVKDIPHHFLPGGDTTEGA